VFDLAPLRRAAEANMRYYSALGQATADYVKAVVDIWQGLARPDGAVASTAPSTPSPSIGPALVLEAAAGASARAAFVVANKLARPVTAPVVTSTFADPSGATVQPTLRIEPGRVALGPGDRAIVQVMAAITDDLVTGVAYRGRLSVPGLSDDSVAVVIRRLEPVAGEIAVADAPAKRSRHRGKRG